MGSIAPEYTSRSTSCRSPQLTLADCVCVGALAHGRESSRGRAGGGVRVSVRIHVCVRVSVYVRGRTGGRVSVRMRVRV